MTPAEIVAALTAEGLDFEVTERGTIACEPAPSPGLLLELRQHKAEVLALRCDPDRHGWEMPSPEAMAAARSARPRADAQRPTAADRSIALGSPREMEER